MGLLKGMKPIDAGAISVLTIGGLAWLPHLWDQDWLSMLPSPAPKIIWAVVAAAAAYTAYRIFK